MKAVTEHNARPVPVCASVCASLCVCVCVCVCVRGAVRFNDNKIDLQ